MTSREQLIKARLAILAMASQLKNVARACKLAGMSRSQFYVLKKAYETSGQDGLAPRLRRKPEMPNRTPPPLENRILLKTLENPSISYLRLARNMKSEGISVTPSMIRYVWRRHGLSTRSARLRWIKKRHGQTSAPQRADDHNMLQEASTAVQGPVTHSSSPASDISAA